MLTEQNNTNEVSTWTLKDYGAALMKSAVAVGAKRMREQLCKNRAPAPDSQALPND